MAREDARSSFLARRRSTAAAPERVPLTVGLPTFWKAMILTSFAINLILIFIIIFGVAFFVRWRNDIASTTVGVQGFARSNIEELQDVVVQLRTAHIRTTIPIDEPLPIELNVPIDQTTLVTTTADVPISVPASIDMGPFGQLYPNVNLNLPAGTPLMIKLKLDVPLEATIPVQLNVPVDIPMEETELAPQFERLGNIVDRLVTPAAPLLGMDDAEAQPPEESSP